MKISGYIVAVVLFLATGCSTFSPECELVVQPYAMVSSGSDIQTPAYMARVYAFYVDEREALEFSWQPDSYTDAEAGIVRHRTTGEVRSHGLAAGQGDDDYIHLVLSSSPVLLVAIDPINGLCAWRVFKYQMPLERVFVPVTFKSYQSTPYKENEWTFMSKNDKNDETE
ncbi:MAG: hypothetical protein LBV18_07025 [Alistipes sp.]|nr:hypothetical protein [Alistipes sp.]